MSEFPPVIFVDVKRSKSRFPWKRPQRWYVVILSAGNRRPLFKSENYTNHDDAVDAAWKAMGWMSTAFLREAEHGNVLMRRASEVAPQ